MLAGADPEILMEGGTRRRRPRGWPRSVGVGVVTSKRGDEIHPAQRPEQLDESRQHAQHEVKSDTVGARREHPGEHHETQSAALPRGSTPTR